MLRPIAELLDFLENKMSMQAVYQPVVILHLLTRGGVSSRKDLARTLSGYDEMGLDYWDRVLMKNPKLTLVDTHKIIRYDQDSSIFRLNFDLANFDAIDEAKNICEKAILQWIKRALDSQKLDEKEVLRHYRVLSVAQCSTVQSNSSSTSDIDDFEVEEFAMHIAIDYLKRNYPDQNIDQQPYQNPGFDILVGSEPNPICYVKLIATRKLSPAFQVSEYDRQFSIEKEDQYMVIIIHSIDLLDKTYKIHFYSGAIHSQAFLLTPNIWNACLIQD